MLDKLGRLATLVGVIGIAGGALVVSMCTQAPGKGPGEDAAANQSDAALDAGMDASAPTSDASDSQLWDVLCE